MKLQQQLPAHLVHRRPSVIEEEERGLSSRPPFLCKHGVGTATLTATRRRPGGTPRTSEGGLPWSGTVCGRTGAGCLSLRIRVVAFVSLFVSVTTVRLGSPTVSYQPSLPGYCSAGSRPTANRRLGKRVGCKPSGVRIPYPPHCQRDGAARLTTRRAALPLVVSVWVSLGFVGGPNADASEARQLPTDGIGDVLIPTLPSSAKPHSSGCPALEDSRSVPGTAALAQVGRVVERAQ